MKGALPVLAAGSTFAGFVVAGLLAGVWLDSRTGSTSWVLLMLLAGFAAGLFAAYRLVARALRP